MYNVVVTVDRELPFVLDEHIIVDKHLLNMFDYTNYIGHFKDILRLTNTSIRLRNEPIKITRSNILNGTTMSCKFLFVFEKYNKKDMIFISKFAEHFCHVSNSSFIVNKEMIDIRYHKYLLPAQNCDFISTIQKNIYIKDNFRRIKIDKIYELR